MHKINTSLIKQLTVHQHYAVLLNLAESMIDKWVQNTPSGNTEFEYLKANLMRDGMIAGVRAFFNEIDLIASKE
jgi:hypothetical protein